MPIKARSGCSLEVVVNPDPCLEVVRLGSERTKGPIGALAPRGVSVPRGHIVFLRIASNLGLNLGFDLFFFFFCPSLTMDSNFLKYHIGQTKRASWPLVCNHKCKVMSTT